MLWGYIMQKTIYEDEEKNLYAVLKKTRRRLFKMFKSVPDGEYLYEHIGTRIKTDDSMRGKCVRKGYPLTKKSALELIHDAIGIRIVTVFQEDIYRNVGLIKSVPEWKIESEKDFIKTPKANGYRGYHIILSVPLKESGKSYFVEIQIRTIAMDTWSALEHRLWYKKDEKYAEEIAMCEDLPDIQEELKRCSSNMENLDKRMSKLRKKISERTNERKRQAG